MSGWMTSEQRYAWQTALELKLRRVSGVAFQDFFSDLMKRCHGDDFVIVRPFGSLGDRGCDGYLATTGRVFACYGKLNDAVPTVAALTGKMDDDYDKACTNLGSIMKEWTFVHNMMDGTPTDATVIKIGQLKKDHPEHTFTVLGPQGIEDRVLSLREAEIISLIGPAVSAEDTRNMKVEEVAELVDAVMAAVDASSITDDLAPKPVPFEKLEFNKLPPHWCYTIKSAMVNATFVGSYFDTHFDVTRGDRVAGLFKARYEALKAQGLSPGAIIGNLYDDIVGKGTVTNDRVIAAQAIIAFLFEACDIFEDKPVSAV